MRRGSKGQFIVGGVVFLAMLMVVVQAMVYWTQREAKWTKKEARTTTAFYLAETGYNRAIWKLREKSANFESVLTGTPLEGYHNDTTYTDVNGGSYKINLTAGPDTHQITILAAGKDSTSGEYRAIQAVVERDLVPAPLIAPSISLGGSMKVHWGPLQSTGNINLGAGGNELYPRKLARGAITVTGGGGYPDRDTNPTPQNTDNKEWWSYNESPGVPDPVAPNLEYYKQLAIAQGTYYPGASTTISGLVSTSTSAVYYFEGSARFTGSYHFRGVLIVLGSLDFAGSGKTPEGNMTLTPPSDAWREYAKNTPSTGTGCVGGGGAGASDDGNYSNNLNAEGDKACVDQYPGDAGYHSVETFRPGLGCSSHNHLGGSGGSPISFSGYVYVRQQFMGVGNAAIHGTVQVAEGGSWGTGSIELYFDPTLRIASSDSTTVNFTTLSWQEVIPSNF